MTAMRRGNAHWKFTVKTMLLDASTRNEGQQGLRDLRNTREEYLSNQWRKSDQPLHQRATIHGFSVREMAKFHSKLTMKTLEHRQCETCREQR